MSAKKIYADFLHKLGSYSPEEASAIAFIVLEKLGIKKTDILTDKMISFENYNQLNSIIERLQNHEPVQYILEEADFFGRSFFVSKGVLIPRPETEELVSLILKTYKSKSVTILDIGTGSGCIAITLSKELVYSTVLAIDKSEKALSIASRNAANLNAKVIFKQADILNFTDDNPELDIVVSNPPYIPEKEKTSLNKNVVQYEPETALFVPDSDPLIFYKEIIKVLHPKLKSGGEFYFEIHENFGEQIKDVLKANHLLDIRVMKDLSGKDRFAAGKKA
jgi:release factor glutamine methyltransferase